MCEDVDNTVRINCDYGGGQLEKAGSCMRVRAPGK